MGAKRGVIQKLFLAIVALSFMTAGFLLGFLHSRPTLVMNYLDVQLRPDLEMGHQRHFRYLLVPVRAQCSPFGQTLVVYIHSAPFNRERRRLIRHSWGQHDVLARAGATLVFVMGRPRSRLVELALLQEVSMFGDILQADFIDSYRNLTLKAVSGLQWVTQHCRGARYVLKADDDVLVDIVQLSALLLGYVDHVTRARGVLLCNLYTQNYTRVVRDPECKWGVSREEYPGDFYPEFCQGAAYAMSADVAGALYRQSQVTPYFRLDDVYVTGILRAGVGLKAMSNNEAYFTGAQSLDLLSQNRSVKPMFFEEHDRKKFYKLWTYIKDGKCCPRIVPRPFDHIESMYT